MSSRALIAIRKACKIEGCVCVCGFIPCSVFLLDYVIAKILRMTEFLLCVLSFINTRNFAGVCRDASCGEGARLRGETERKRLSLRITQVKSDSFYTKCSLFLSNSQSV